MNSLTFDFNGDYDPTSYNNAGRSVLDRVNDWGHLAGNTQKADRVAEEDRVPFILPKHLAKKYPKLAEYLKNIADEYKNKPEKFKDAFRQYSELSDLEIEEMLTYNKGPVIGVQNLDEIDTDINGNGRIDEINGITRVILKDKDKEIYENIGEGLIFLDDDIVDKLEAATTEEEKEIAKILVESTIFHEGTHVGDIKKDNRVMTDKKGQKIETGKAFEEKVYGQNIGRGNVDTYVESKKNKK